MLATITVTPVANVDYNKMKVIDDQSVFKVYYDWEDIVDFYDTTESKEVKKKIVQMSVYDDRLIINGIQHHCLHMTSK